MDWDEFPEAHAWQEDRLRLPWNLKRANASTVKETTGGDVARDGCVSIEESGKLPDQSESIEQRRQI